MKKKAALLLSTLLTICTAITAFGAEGVIKDGRTLVPVRGVFESLGFTVDWNAETNKASISDGIHEVSVIKGMSYFKADGSEIYPDVPQQIINGSLYLPLRAIGDAVGADTSWDNDNKMAHISYNGNDVYVKCAAETSNNTSSNNNSGNSSGSNSNVSSSSTVKYYSNTDVPDLGALFGVEPNYISDDGTIHSYPYYSRIDSDIYLDLLEKSGYQFDLRRTEAIETETDGPIMVYTKSHNYVAVGAEKGEIYILTGKF